MGYLACKMPSVLGLLEVPNLYESGFLSDGRERDLFADAFLQLSCCGVVERAVVAGVGCKVLLQGAKVVLLQLGQLGGTPRSWGIRKPG